MHDIRLMWTHPKMENIARPDDFCIRLSPCVCCGYADVGDIQAPDLTPPGLPAKKTTVDAADAPADAAHASADLLMHQHQPPAPCEHPGHARDARHQRITR